VIGLVCIFSFANSSPRSEYCTALVAYPEEWLALITQGATKPAYLKKGVIVQQPGRTVSESDVARIKSELSLDSLVVTFGTDETSGVFLANGEALPSTQVEVQQGKVLVKGYESNPPALPNTARLAQLTLSLMQVQRL